MALEKGFLLKDRYRIENVLGQGGMGAVYRAIDENLDMDVAVKENSFFSEDYARQFQREAKILASLRHPNLPRVFDYFVIDQVGQYLVMDYIEGYDLRQWMTREGNITEIEALYIGISICDALTYLHSQDLPITHRDIKPGNIKITPQGEIVLVDFGLVKQLSDREVTTTAARAMTPGYSPPEQYGPAPTDHRSDIYSLGATLYSALAGYLPEDSLARITGKEELTPLGAYNEQISKKTFKAIEKALALRFEDRWQSARDFQDALTQARRSIPIENWASDHLNITPLSRKALQESGSDMATQGNAFQRSVAWVRHWVKTARPAWLIFAISLILFVITLTASVVYPRIRQNFINPRSTATIRPTETVFTIPSSTKQAITPSATVIATLAPAISPTTVSVGSDEMTPTATPIGGGAGVIAFVSERNGNPQLWLLNVMDGDLTPLTDLADGACQPDWSPDGTQIVFTSPCSFKRTRYTGSSLYVIDVDTGAINPLPVSLEGDFDPAWSPDGQWIAYTSLINNRMQIMKINVGDFSIVRLSDGAYEEYDPGWSPDGKRLVFTRNSPVGQIWIIDSDGQDPIRFSFSGPVDNTNPEWYPQEEIILFSQSLGAGSPSTQVFGMRLTDIGKDEEYPVIPANSQGYTPLLDNVDVSPDGVWLAFDYWFFDRLSDIYIMTFPGANLTQLTDDPAMDYCPAWRP
jgi:serine/threonine protein kinase/Tol biopolymer transport system component